jgi:hypothetical protein
LINDKVLPARSMSERPKIPKLAVGLLLASAYDIWPPECRPHYAAEELRWLAGITVEEVAAKLGTGRSSAYESVRNHQIPAIQLPHTDRWVVPEDAATQMEAYDLRNLGVGESRPSRAMQKAWGENPPSSDETLKTDHSQFWLLRCGRRGLTPVLGITSRNSTPKSGGGFQRTRRNGTLALSS